MKSTKKAAKFNVLKSTVARLNGKSKNNFSGATDTTTGSDTSTTTSLMTVSHFL